MSNFNQYSKYYDLLYKDKDYKAESDFVVSKIKQFAPTATTILELGSGSANHAQYFCANDFSVFGIERSSDMVAESVAKNIKNFEVTTGDIVSTIINKKFGVAISLFHVLSYLTDNESLIQCFKNTHNHLEEGGVFIFDVWYTPAVYHQKPETRVRKLENNEIQITRIAQSEMITSQNVVNVNFEVIITDKKTNRVEVLNELHPMRHFSIPEIDLIAKLTGFEILHTEEFLTQNPASENTWGVCFVLRKVEAKVEVKAEK